MAETKSLAEQVDEFLDRHDMSPVTFGRRAMRDPHFVRDIKATPPRRVWPETEERVLNWMRQHEASVEQGASV